MKLTDLERIELKAQITISRLKAFEKLVGAFLCSETQGVIRNAIELLEAEYGKKEMKDNYDAKKHVEYYP